MKSKTYVMPQLLSPHAAYTCFAPRCAEVEPVTCNADPAVVTVNIDAAFRAIEPRLNEIPRILPTIDLGFVLEMPNLARGLSYAAGRVIVVASSGEIADKLAVGRRMREPMLLVAEGLAAMPEALLPPERVANIRKGTGPYDTARDLTDLVGLFREFAAEIKHKHPFDEAWLAKAEEIGVWLQQAITPSGAAKTVDAASNTAARERDGFWAMIQARDAKLRVIARALFENDADAMVPALLSRAAVRKGGAEVIAEPVTPTPVSPAGNPAVSGEHPVVQSAAAVAAPVAAKSSRRGR